MMKPFLACGLGLLAASSGSPASYRAKLTYDFDLSSLHHMATEIVLVEGRPELEWDEKEWPQFLTTRIRKSYKGSLKKGDEIRVSMNFYSLRLKAFEGVDEGASERPERLLYFLEKDLGPDSDWSLVPSGVKLISAGKVWGFRQWSNPGPYLPRPMIREKGAAKDSKTRYTFAQLEADIIEAGEHVQLFLDLLEMGNRVKRNRALVAFIRSEPQRMGFEPGSNRKSHLIGLAAGKLAESGDAGACFEALRHMPYSWWRCGLVRVLASEKGAVVLGQALSAAAGSEADQLLALRIIGDASFAWARSDNGRFKGDLIRHVSRLLKGTSHQIRIAASLALARCSGVSYTAIPGERFLQRRQSGFVGKEGLARLAEAYTAEKDGYVRYVMAAAYGKAAGLEAYQKLTGDELGLACGLEISQRDIKGRQAWRVRFDYKLFGHSKVRFRTLGYRLERFGEGGGLLETRFEPWEEIRQMPGTGGGSRSLEPLEPLTPGRWRIMLEAETAEPKPRRWRSTATVIEVSR